MKWILPDKRIATYKAKGRINEYQVKQYFVLDMQWVIEIFKSSPDNEFVLRIPAMFRKMSKAKKVCELMEKGWFAPYAKQSSKSYAKRARLGKQNSAPRFCRHIWQRITGVNNGK